MLKRFNSIFRFGWVALLLSLAATVIYYPALDGPFIFDDFPAIRDNPTIRALWPLPGPFWAYRECPTAGRPIPNFTFALQYYLHGDKPYGYHLVNLVLHVLGGLILWATLRRLLLLPRGEGGEANVAAWRLAPAQATGAQLDRHAGMLALAVAGVWIVHPINTETVAYITQRTELCVAIFLFLMMYALVRAGSAASPGKWQALTVLFCALGMVSKEVMAGAPLLALALDRLFLSSSWRQLWRRGWLMYGGLASCWLITAAILYSQPRPFSTGFNRGLTMLDYLFSQAISLCWYLWLCFVPSGLRLTYWWGLAPSFTEALPAGLFILTLLGLTGYALYRGHPAGFAGLWFFIILGPSSSFIPIVTEVTADRRMYLPSAAVIALCVLGGMRVLRTWRPPLLPRTATYAGVFVIGVLTITLGVVAQRRAAQFADPAAIWADNAKLEPNNHFAHHNLGVALMERASAQTAPDRFQPALREFMRALQLSPLPETFTGLANCYTQLNDDARALWYLQKAVEFKPSFAPAWNRWGLMLLGEEKMEEAVEKFQNAIRYEPTRSDYYGNLGLAWIKLKRFGEALETLQTAVEMEPSAARYHGMLGLAASRMQKTDQAVDHLQRAIALDPTDDIASFELAIIHMQLQRWEAAAAMLEKVLALVPDNADARFQLGVTLRKAGKLEAAISQLRLVTETKPGHALAWLTLAKTLGDVGDVVGAEKALGQALAADGMNLEARLLLGDLYAMTERSREALAQYEQAVRDHPLSSPAHNQLGIALAQQQRLSEAAAHFQKALELDPQNQDARHNLNRARGGGKP